MMPFGYGLPQGFWLDLFILLAAVAVIVGVIPSMLRRKVGADKKKWYSTDYINPIHKKGDVTIRITGLVLLFAGIIFFANDPLILLGISMLILIGQLVFQAFIEWKYTENRKNYKMTICEIFFALVSFVLVFLWINPS